MKVKDLKTFFSMNSRLLNDFDFKGIDSKHKKIIKNSKNNIENLNSSNFRNWDDQNDMGLNYSMTFISKIFLGLNNTNIYHEFT